MGKLALVIVAVLWGLWQAVDMHFYSQVLARVREARSAYARLDLEKLEKQIDDFGRSAGDSTANVLIAMVRDAKLELLERRIAQRALARYALTLSEAKLAKQLHVLEALAVDLEVPTDDTTAEKLVDYLAGRDPAYRLAASKALGALGAKAPKEAAPALVEVASKDPILPSRAEAVRALGRIGAKAGLEAVAEAAGSEVVALAEAGIEALGRLGGEAARKRLEKLLADHPVAAARALETLGDAAAAEALAKGAGSRDVEARLWAARTLFRLGDARGLPILVAGLGSALTGERTVALRVSAGLASDKVIEQVVASATAGNPEIRQAAAFALGHTPGPVAVGALRALLTDDVPAVRVAAVQAMGLHPDPSLSDTIRKLLGGGDSGVLVAAIEAAADRQDQNAVEPLRAIVHNKGGQSDYVRQVAWRALKRLTGKAPELSGQDLGLFVPRPIDVN